MAFVAQRSGGDIYYAVWKGSHGRQIRRSTKLTSKREAQKLANDWEAADRQISGNHSDLQRAYRKILETGIREAEARELTLARFEELLTRAHRVANPDFRVVSLAEHLAAWVGQQEAHVSPKSLKVYQDMPRRFLTAVGARAAGEPVGNLTQEQVIKALTKITKQKIKRTERTIKAATANMDLRALRRALCSAVDQGLARSNAAEGVRPLPPDDSTERAPFTVVEVRQILDHKDTSAEWHGAILIAAHTGLRLGDVIKLNSGHVEGTRFVLRPEKTKRSRKAISVPLSPPILAWIADRDGDFFPTLKNKKTGTLSTQFRRIMDKAGVPREVKLDGDTTAKRSFHSLRHSFTSWLADNDVHSDVRQQLTGHSSAGVHARYTHHDEALERAIEKLPSLQS